MKKALLLVSAPLLLAACATDNYGSPNVSSRAYTGILLGGALGAAAGRAVGLDPITGAGVGMVAGGVAGLAIKGPVVHDKQYYRDTNGYCYYVDATGVSHYDDPPIRC